MGGPWGWGDLQGKPGEQWLRSLGLFRQKKRRLRRHLTAVKLPVRGSEQASIGHSGTWCDPWGSYAMPGFGLNDPDVFLPTQHILWFCGSHFSLALEKKNFLVKFATSFSDSLVNKRMQFYCRMVNRCSKGAAFQLQLSLRLVNCCLFAQRGKGFELNRAM